MLDVGQEAAGVSQAAPNAWISYPIIESSVASPRPSDRNSDMAARNEASTSTPGATRLGIIVVSHPAPARAFAGRHCGSLDVRSRNRKRIHSATLQMPQPDAKVLRNVVPRSCHCAPNPPQHPPRRSAPAA
jgi:hypothetical protein